MRDEYWHKQGREPLFGDLWWSRPENRALAGKLLIIGGNAHGFAAPAQAYAVAEQAGIGVSKVLLPDTLKKTVGKILDNGEFAPSTPSGSFNQAALAEWLDWTAWADGVLLAGDLGRNSETAIVLERFCEKTAAPLVITKDAADYTYNFATNLLKRPQTSLVLSLAQLQKLASATNWPTPVTYGMSLLQLIDFLHDFTLKYPCYIITQHHDTLFAAVSGQVSTTAHSSEVWRVTTAAHIAVWWLQNPSQPFEALTTAVRSAIGNTK